MIMSKKRNKSRSTTMERMEELRKGLALEKSSKKKKSKKSTIIDIRKISKSKKKKLKKMINPDVAYFIQDYTKDQLNSFWYHYELFENLYDEEWYKERDKRIKRADKQREEHIDKMLREIDVEGIDSLIEIDKIIEDGDNKRYKKFKKYGYEMGEDGIFFINEDKLIDNLKKRKKEFRKANEEFKAYIEKTMGDDSKYLKSINNAERRLSKDVKNLIQSFEAVAIESSIFRLK
jgi:hypothetical protein